MCCFGVKNGVAVLNASSLFISFCDNTAGYYDTSLRMYSFNIHIIHTHTSEKGFFSSHVWRLRLFNIICLAM